MVGGMLIGPIMLLIVVPALQIVFLGRDSGAGAEAKEGERENVR